MQRFFSEVADPFIFPSLEIGFQRSIRHTGSKLHEPVNASRCPLHLLFLGEAFRDDLIDGRFYKAG